MEKIAVFCSWADAQLSEDTALALHLPPELRTQILDSKGSEYLNILAIAAQLPQCTDRLFSLYEPVFVDLANRWVGKPATTLADALPTLSSLARLVPFAPHFKSVLVEVLNSSVIIDSLSSSGSSTLANFNDDQLTTLLLSVFRLLSYDRDLFGNLLHPVFFSLLLSHESLCIRYLSVECLCMVMHFADAFSEDLVQKYVGQHPVLGGWEGRHIDYRLLKLWEEQRWKALDDAVKQSQRARSQGFLAGFKALSLSDLHLRTAVVGSVLLPRTRTLPTTPGTFVLAPNAQANLSKVGAALLEPKPLLIAGPTSSGKTSLVFEAARILDKAESMITLHLNEQTDAKSLIGLHESSPLDHTFVWQPGVLVRALQEGRWVLIEDIDRAPAEVLGVLRPIIENGDLFIPSRKQRVQARDGFRVLATMKTSTSESVKLPTRSAWLANPRLWSVLRVHDYPMAEISHLIQHRYPAIDDLLEIILDVHKKILELCTINPAFRAAQSRKASLRDLLKWCRRISKRIESQDPRQASQGVPEVFKIEIFKDAIDCYASHLGDDFLYNKVAASIAQSMNIAPQQMQHYLAGSVPSFQHRAQSITIGRTTLQRYASRRSRVLNTPFADTSVSRRCLENFCAGVGFAEPYLLVGETGVGKTSLIQYVAGLVGQELTVINLSQQSEATELLGGLQPVTTRSLILPLIENFNALFDDTFSATKNEKFQDALSKALTRQNWSRILKLWLEAISMAEKVLQDFSKTSSGTESVRTSKRRRLATPRYEDLRNRWTQFADAVRRVRSQAEHGDKSHAFAFVEGRLVRAVRDGGWVLLDEINLASSDTLDHITSLLQDSGSGPASILLAEAGSVEKVTAHPNFRIFAAMNPATDTGKKDLAPGIRSRFTELFVHSGDKDLNDLVKIIQCYLGRVLENDERAAAALGSAYLDIQNLSLEHKLIDGAGDLPHFSIRSLVRCLLYTVQHSASHGLRRAMFEGFAMSFFTVLSRESEALALPLVINRLLSDVKNVKSFLAQQPKVNADGKDFVAFRHHLITKGPNSPDFQPHYIRTPSVERNLVNLARAASMRRFPILLQGPTSAGKTSMVEYLAKLSGNKFLRINNHEHTDLQEYLGSYSSDNEGKLRFTDGVLVDALRQGHWLVLDELNLAPPDVLEALNRLLDDNRELMVPETQEIIRPHPNFLLFATQNPAGLYGGRKRMSRAFRNRFLEIHFDEIPEEELDVILRERTQIAPSFCAQIVAVYKKLSIQRQSSRLFDRKYSFATLRDLFRWASRPVSDRQELANHGFMLLGERVRDPSERQIVKATIEETMKLTIDENALYGASVLSSNAIGAEGIVWTAAMRRLYVLVSSALRNDEPVLLIGETGCGKTQICQVIAAAFGSPLNIYNAHTNTETGDLIGSQRPVRSRAQIAADVVNNFRLLAADNADVESLNTEQTIARFNQLDTSLLEPEAVAKTRSSITAYECLFEWSDGSLVRSMRCGEHFLLDEISLADDSVLERLNSLLEPARTLLLAEKGATDNVVVAHPSFQFLSTMNPGGDYGKRELSAALRNRLTEIWVPPLSQEDDVIPILAAKLKPEHSDLAKLMLKFSLWFKRTFHSNITTTIPLRDLLAWVKFVNSVPHLTSEEAFLHGAAMVYIDSIGANPAGMIGPTTSVQLSRLRCLEFLQTLVSIDVSKFYHEVPVFCSNDTIVQVGAFALPKDRPAQSAESGLVFEAPTTLQNAMRLVRALQMNRPILLEGSPGVGKTAIVTALAQILGKCFTRINLSDQTDLMDLFGADAPAENESLGRFTWKDGPLLQAMQRGGWVLLDEMNLASQSVLEGLNSCIDHRKEVYIAELDKTFTCHPDFALFAAQNPHHEGGGRKGLPASFVNRFTVVHADPLREEDLLCICHATYRHSPMSPSHIETVVRAVSRTHSLVSTDAAFTEGGLWDANLRDVSRWLQLCSTHPDADTSSHYATIIEHRFRNTTQQSQLQKISTALFPERIPESYYPRLTPMSLQVGISFLGRDRRQQSLSSSLPIAVSQLPQAKSIITAVSQAWPVILGGPSGAGKTQLIRSLAAANGTKLLEISMNTEIDTMDLLGGFEQYDEHREIEDIKSQAQKASHEHLQHAFLNGDSTGALTWMHLSRASQSPGTDARSLLSALQLLPKKWSMNALESRLNSIIDHKQQPGSRFVWNDGILIDAIREGVWLVLDNANLCNASVLDRLNSLLEPNGLIILSEQHNANGGVRIITPHPNFRIFLTLDPRNGELSRAIRNRSLEVFLNAEICGRSVSRGLQYPWAAAISRLRDAFKNSESENVLNPFFDNFAYQDIELAKSQPLPEPGIEDRPLALVNAVIAKRVGSNAGKLWSQIQELTSALPSRWGPDDVGLLNAPMQLILNEPLFVHDNMTYSRPEVAELFRLWQVAQNLSEIWSRLHTVRNAASLSKTKSTTLFENSHQASTDMKRKQHPMPPFFAFVEKIFHHLSESTIRALRIRSHLLDSTSLMAVARYTNEMIRFADGTELNMAALQALLHLGHDLARQLMGQHKQLVDGLQDALGLFQLSQLETGLGLPRMWQSWKPGTPYTFEQLKAKMALEQMIKRFDDVAPRLPQPRSALMAVKTRLLDLLGSAWKQDKFSGILQAFGESIESLENQGERRRPIGIYFQDVFDSFLRRTTILNRQLSSSSLQLISTFSNENNLRTSWLLEDGNIQEALRTLTLVQKDLGTHTRELGSLLVSKTAGVSDQPLRSLERIQEEFLTMANLLSSNLTVFTEDVRPVIRRCIRLLLSNILLSHKDLLSKSTTGCIDAAGDFNFARLARVQAIGALQVPNSETSYFHQVHWDHIQPAVQLQESNSGTGLGKALVHTCVAALILVVPNRLFDPAVYESTRLAQHRASRHELQVKIDSQRNFNQHLMGQDSSLALRLLEEDLTSLGDEPLVFPFLRPEVSQLARVQEEFSNVLRTVVHDLPRALLRNDGESDEIVFEAGRLNQNVSRLVDRLGKLDRAYDDLVVPVSQLLQALGLGASLMASGIDIEHSARHWNQVITHIPMLGAQPDMISGWPVESVLSHNSDSVFWLKHHILCRNLPLFLHISEDKSSQVEYLQIIDRFYQQWKTRLTKDQIEAQERSKYYTYRGDEESDEDGERGLEEMFPSYEKEHEILTTETPTGYDGRAIAVQMASLHEKIFGLEGNVINLQHVIVDALQLQASGSCETQGAQALKDHFPGILLQMESEMQFLNGENAFTAVNIYTDCSIPEARKVFNLVQSIQARFYEISERWPEHALPMEVIAFSEEVLDFKINSPLAKLLTKTEKLLEIVAQWQSVASREWSVASFVDELTTLIVSWRRLELASWSRLLDFEKQRSDEDAQAWYFIAYEAVVYNSRRVVETCGDVSGYAQELARTVEEFLRSTTVAQYVPRLRLLVILQKALHESAELDPRLGTISTSVASIIAHYRRYVPSMEEALQSCRSELEKAVVEQIKLASWKDTNILALKDSARRSHQKLFAIVRKYRALLRKPVSVLKSEGFMHDQTVQLKQLFVQKEEPEYLQRAMTNCVNQISDWNERPERLRNPLRATSSMRLIYNSCIPTFDAAAELAALRDDVARSIKTLRKETPPTLSDKNTPLVRHLRERKRRLFTDIVKSITQMGVRRNLGTGELEKQASICIVLSTCPDLICNDNSDSATLANSAFHELIDGMPIVRAALAEHSPDLTDGDVRRSIGLLEGMLYMAIRQREGLANSVKDLRNFEEAASLLQALAQGPGSISLVPSQAASLKLCERLAWLPAIIGVACQVLAFQIKHSGLALQSLLDELQCLSASLMALRDKIALLPQLPRGFASKLELQTKEDTLTILNELRETLEKWHNKEPNVDHLTRQLMPWTEIPNDTQQRMTNAKTHKSAVDIDESATTAANVVFVALQQLASIETKPISDAEEPGWLFRNDKSFIECWSALHVPGITERLQSLLEKLPCIHDNDLSLAVSLVTVIAPILEQFHMICQHSLDRQMIVHLEMTRLASYLVKAFSSLVTEGFCSPSGSSDGKEREGKMESGTGLGDGEGAEDISKDVGDDEDLSEFAKDGQKEDREGSIEDTEDAVDMGMGELEGESGQAEDRDGKGGSDEEYDEEGDEKNEETGSIDDLDPTAVDEKMWDDAKEQAEKENEKDLKGEKGKGEKVDEQTTADEGKSDQGDDRDADVEGEEMNEEEADEEDHTGATKAEGEHTDPHFQDEKALDLPEDMQLTGEEGKEDELSDDAMDELSDVGQPDEVDEVGEQDREDEGDVDEEGDEADPEGEADAEGQVEDIGVDDRPIPEKLTENENEKNEGEMQHDEYANADGETGAVNQLQDNVDPNQQSEGQNQTDRTEDERQQQEGQAAENDQDGKMGRGALEQGQGHETTLERQEREALKKLADVLDQWHLRREILNPSEDLQHDNLNQDSDMAEADFEHVENEDEGDAQALGTAGADQVQSLDRNRATQDGDIPIEEDTALPDIQEQAEQDKLAERLTRFQVHANEESREDGSYVPDAQQQLRIHDQRNQDSDIDDIVAETASEVDNLSLTFSSAPPMSSSTAAQLWHRCSHLTHQSSLILTEQLRLILSPTTATKLRGDFRSGKRLNIKRIIPYIASGYKRDKIWMRRSVPSKRNYQILIAVDDSKSMAEGAADVMALQSLSLLCKSLAMLEVGDVSVMAFGEDVNVSHSFGDTWRGDESGIEVFGGFGFEQRGTDVKKLLETGLRELGEARLKAPATGGEETWQLFLIVSDGHCGEHERVRRLVRRGKEERVLCVFIILDGLNTVDPSGVDDATRFAEGAASATPPLPASATTRGSSILDLKEALFEPDPNHEGEMRVVTRRYLERFPFEYYLVVRDVGDLPGVLARCLRGWLGSIMDG